jgi:hypothetical protein
MILEPEPDNHGYREDDLFDGCNCQIVADGSTVDERWDIVM